MEKILISACFLNNLVRYDGTAYDVKNKLGIEALNTITRWQEQGRLVALCPEMSGGLPVPRPAAEIIQVDDLQFDSLQQESAQVKTITGVDVTHEFRAGAQVALARCQQQNIKMAVLTESSPSCGSSTIYNGQFSAKKIAGEGVTTALLRQNGIQVFSQFELVAADCYLNNLEH
ncbi:MAG: DUF523 domain-containing protein [Oleispira sp.]|nr:DUF523 domain-containing protein [Oleispira sp.]